MPAYRETENKKKKTIKKEKKQVFQNHRELRLEGRWRTIAYTQDYKKETYSTKEEWLEHRGIGGSTASAILNKNPWMNCLELYNALVRTERKTYKSKGNDATERGTKLEPLIRREFAIDHPNAKIEYPGGNVLFRRTDKPYLTASLDGMIEDDGESGILEIKTHDMRSGDEAIWADGIPEYYFIQLIHYLMVMQDKSFATLCARLRYYGYKNDKRYLERVVYRYYTIYRSDEAVAKWIAYLEKEETDFWENHVLKKIPPMPRISI